MFSEKLNFLMEITRVQNNMLAAAVSLDASHISDSVTAIAGFRKIKRT